MELDVDNSDGFLMPGSFAYVTLHVPLHSLAEIPVSGLVVRGTNTFVAAVGGDRPRSRPDVDCALGRVAVAHGRQLGDVDTFRLEAGADEHAGLVVPDGADEVARHAETRERDGGGGGGAPMMLSSIHLPRSTGEVLLGSEVIIRIDPLPRIPQRFSSARVTRRN